MSNDCHRQVHDERCRIKSLLSGGLSMRGIAGDLNRSPGMVSREIARTRRYGASDVPRKLTGERGIASAPCLPRWTGPRST